VRLSWGPETFKTQCIRSVNPCLKASESFHLYGLLQAQTDRISVEFTRVNRTTVAFFLLVNIALRCGASRDIVRSGAYRIWAR
jgi:hypothetical protein